jgi:hypothetical protein
MQTHILNPGDHTRNDAEAGRQELPRCTWTERGTGSPKGVPPTSYLFAHNYHHMTPFFSLLRGRLSGRICPAGRRGPSLLSVLRTHWRDRAKRP